MLENLPNLTTLDLLTDGELTDQGVRHSSRFRDLKFRRLRGLRITDAGLHYLRALNNLTRLDRKDTVVRHSQMKSDAECTLSLFRIQCMRPQFGQGDFATAAEAERVCIGSGVK